MNRFPAVFLSKPQGLSAPDQTALACQMQKTLSRHWEKHCTTGTEVCSTSSKNPVSSLISLNSLKQQRKASSSKWIAERRITLESKHSWLVALRAALSMCWVSDGHTLTCKTLGDSNLQKNKDVMLPGGVAEENTSSSVSQVFLVLFPKWQGASHCVWPSPHPAASDPENLPHINTFINEHLKLNSCITHSGMPIKAIWFCFFFPDITSSSTLYHHWCKRTSEQQN